jgi:uncharacterized protein (TIGR02001 family)
MFPFSRLALTVTSAAAMTSPAFAQSADTRPERQPLAVSGGVTIVSQYRFRGISLSDENPAIQGTINLNHESGFYAGAWASSTDGFGELGGSNVELDLFGGYRREVASGVTLDAGLLYYAYPGSTGGDFEFFEPYANASGAIGPATAEVGVAFAPSQDALGGNSNIYVFGDLSTFIPNSPTGLTGHIGWSKGDTALSPGGEYMNWSLGANVTWRSLTFGVAYVDTDINAAEAASVGAARDPVDAAVVFSLTASF